jgi:hypothetical protein
MAIEVDYFAWEKWNNVYSNWHGYEHFYVQNGILVAKISYYRTIPEDVKPIITASYTFWAESDTAPITKLLCCMWHNRQTDYGLLRHYYYDVIELDEANAEAFHQDFSALPVPIEVDSEGMPYGDDRYMYHFDLVSRYGNKSYHWDTTSSNFFFSYPIGNDDKIFHVYHERLLNRCEALNAHRYPDTKAIRQIFAAYKKSFQLKVKQWKHQGRWPKLKVLQAYEHEKFPLAKKILEDFPSLELPEWEKLLDFKHYLPRFLECMAFDEDFTAEHETLLFTKLKEADLRSWDEDEQKAIADYFLALFKYSLSYYPSITMSVSSLLLRLSKLEMDLLPFLDYWESMIEYVDSLRHLGVFLETLIEENLADNLPSVLADWLPQPKLEKALIDAINVYQAKRPYAQEFVEALEILQLIRARRANGN